MNHCGVFIQKKKTLNISCVWFIVLCGNADHTMEILYQRTM